MPPNTPPGTVMQVNSPHGMFQIQAPAGVAPGQQFQVQLPAPAQATPPPQQQPQQPATPQILTLPQQKTYVYADASKSSHLLYGGNGLGAYNMYKRYHRDQNIMYARPARYRHYSYNYVYYDPWFYGGLYYDPFFCYGLGYGYGGYGYGGYGYGYDGFDGGYDDGYYGGDHGGYDDYDTIGNDYGQPEEVLPADAGDDVQPDDTGDADAGDAGGDADAGGD
eukprot:CAMPEP_0174697316 /NCGR_PEP_ID=MMETSP1094-20130205/3215_1 /TAXON_ID=156173 /ORGANISM="Chrysochromulina brevifilum, Strain UTEX LB 985" /LENGTH=220 /DNA_ID=CAMNT_0015894269 /DNA_START=33 /DNA_END=692 /DNA_ORIENTATION=-